MVAKRQSPLLAGEGCAGTADQHAGPTDNPALPKVEREKQLEREKCSPCIPKSFLVCCTLSVVEIMGVWFCCSLTPFSSPFSLGVADATARRYAFAAKTLRTPRLLAQNTVAVKR